MPVEPENAGDIESAKVARSLDVIVGIIWVQPMNGSLRSKSLSTVFGSPSTAALASRIWCDTWRRSDPHSPRQSRHRVAADATAEARSHSSAEGSRALTEAGGRSAQGSPAMLSGARRRSAVGSRGPSEGAREPLPAPDSRCPPLQGHRPRGGASELAALLVPALEGGVPHPTAEEPA